MARLWTTGFEIGLGTALELPDGGTTNGASRVTTSPRTGAACARTNSAGSAMYVSYTFPAALPLDRWCYVRAYLKIAALPASGNATIIGFTASSGTPINLSLSATDGKVFCNISGGSVKSAAINDGAWHRIEVGVKPSATQASRAWEFRVDGTTVASGTNQTGDSGTILTLNLGVISPTFTCDLFWDDVAVNDDTGTDQNVWCGAGSVVLLVPTADSAVGTGWTLGTGTAISGNSGKTAVANTPPLGVADLAAGSDPKQIRNASSNANSNYDATMTTYTAAGMGSSDVASLVLPIVITAAPVATAAKLGTVGVVSNPAIANVSLGSAGTAGAFWQGNAAGTWQTGWKASAGTPTYSPSVTLGTAPVMRITQVTASTRIAMCCFMGIYVEYSPPTSNTYTKSGYAKENG